MNVERIWIEDIKYDIYPPMNVERIWIEDIKYDIYPPMNVERILNMKSRMCKKEMWDNL